MHERFLHYLVYIAVLMFLLLSVDMFACTLAIINGDATMDGHPLLMKTRDCPDINQEFVFNDSGLYAYIGVTNAGITDQVWGGLNETGFAIVNANAYNFEDTISGPDDDGHIIRQALAYCQFMEDFQFILDTTNVSGRTRPATYGVMDRLGDGAFFEAGPVSYFVYHCNNTTVAPNGYMVRSTFAYSGDSTNHQAQHRHDRALALLDSAYAAECLSIHFLTQHVTRDLVGSTTNPYPLPFYGYEGSLPYGFINTNTENLINRFNTHSALVIQGIPQGEDPRLSTLWAINGEPISTVALPLWVHAGSVPVEFDGPEIDHSLLNLRSQMIRNYLYPLGESIASLDTWHLVDRWGDGLLPFLFELEDLIYASSDSAWNVWHNQGLPEPVEIESYQNNLTEWTLHELDNWGPPQSPDVSLTVLSEFQIQLDWPIVTMNVFCRPMTISSYTVYASDQPFLERLLGDSLITVASPPVILATPETYRFFQVRCWD